MNYPSDAPTSSKGRQLCGNNQTLFRLTQEQADVTTFPPGCPVMFPHPMLSSACNTITAAATNRPPLLGRGIVQSVFMDLSPSAAVDREFLHDIRLMGSVHDNEDVEIVGEKSLRYAPQCPIYVTNLHDIASWVPSSNDNDDTPLRLPGSVLWGHTSSAKSSLITYSVLVHVHQITNHHSGPRFIELHGLSPNQVQYRPPAREESNSINAEIQQLQILRPGVIGEEEEETMPDAGSGRDTLARETESVAVKVEGTQGQEGVSHPQQLYFSHDPRNKNKDLRLDSHDFGSSHHHDKINENVDWTTSNDVDRPDKRKRHEQDAAENSISRYHHGDVEEDAQSHSSNTVSAHPQHPSFLHRQMDDRGGSVQERQLERHFQIPLWLACKEVKQYLTDNLAEAETTMKNCRFHVKSCVSVIIIMLRPADSVNIREDCQLALDNATHRVEDLLARYCGGPQNEAALGRLFYEFAKSNSMRRRTHLFGDQNTRQQPTTPAGRVDSIFYYRFPNEQGGDTASVAWMSLLEVPFCASDKQFHCRSLIGPNGNRIKEMRKAVGSACSIKIFDQDEMPGTAILRRGRNRLCDPYAFVFSRTNRTSVLEGTQLLSQAIEKHMRACRKGCQMRHS